MEPVVERASIELDGCTQCKSIELHVGEVLEQDVDEVGCAVRALELLPVRTGLWASTISSKFADHDAEVLQPRRVDALVHGRDELDERDDLAVEDFERLGGNDQGIERPFQTVSRLATAWRSMCPRSCTYWSDSGTRYAGG